MIYEAPTIYKIGKDISNYSWQEINGEFKAIDAVSVKYGTNFTSYLSATYHEKGDLLIIGGSVNITTSFTPTYSSSDEYGYSSWPCLMTIDITNKDFQIEDGYYGILEYDKSIKAEIRVGYQNNHIIISARSGVNIPSGWPVLLNIPIFKIPKQ